MCLEQIALHATDFRTDSCSMLYCLSICSKEDKTKEMLTRMRCRKTTLLVLTANMLKLLQRERLVNSNSEKSSFLVGMLSGTKHYCSIDKAYSILPPDMQSNRDFLKHIIACLADIWSQSCHRLSDIQNKSEKDRQQFK